jgi:hypothetical protein
MSLHVELEVAPRRVTDVVAITVRVTNDGTDTADTRLASSALLVDGTPRLEWGLAVGNGARDAREAALPAGETVEVRRDLGAAMLGDPGRHEVVADVGGVRSAPVEVERTT